MELLSHGTPVGQENAAVALVARSGAIPPLVELLSHGTPVAQERAALALSNLAANNANQVGGLAWLWVPFCIESLFHTPLCSM